MGIINSIKSGDKMYKHLRLTYSDSPMYETLEKNFKNFNCIIQRNINTAKKFNMNQNLTNIYQM